MTRASLFRFARVALATVMVALAALGHIFGEAHHAVGQPAQALAWTDAATPDAADPVSGPFEFFQPSASQADSVVKKYVCGCFSGCGCCSTGLWRQAEALAPPALILAESLVAPQPDVPSGLRPKSLFRPPRLTA